MEDKLVKYIVIPLSLVVITASALAHYMDADKVQPEVSQDDKVEVVVEDIDLLDIKGLYETKGDMNVRTEPSPYAEKIGLLLSDKLIEVIDYHEGIDDVIWLKIKEDDVVGWVVYGYLSKVE